MMIRASMVMTFTMGGLAFVPNVFWMLFLRILNELFAGYVPNATALLPVRLLSNVLAMPWAHYQLVSQLVF